MNFIKGDFLNVIKECNKVLEKRKNQLFFNLLCIAYQKIGKIEKSIDVMKEALTFNPNHPDFLIIWDYVFICYINFQKQKNILKKVWK